MIELTIKIYIDTFRYINMKIHEDKKWKYWRWANADEISHRHINSCGNGSILGGRKVGSRVIIKSPSEFGSLNIW